MRTSGSNGLVRSVGLSGSLDVTSITSCTTPSYASCRDSLSMSVVLRLRPGRRSHGPKKHQGMLENRIEDRKEAV